MSQISDAVTYPTEHDDWVKTVLIGGVLSAFGFLLLPLLPVYGYVVRVIRHSLEGDPRPPTFGDWEELVVDGAKAFLVGAAYMLVPAIVGAVTVGGSIVAIATGTRGGAATGIAGLVVGGLLTAVLSIVFGYVAVAAVVAFADERRLGAAFDLGILKPVLLSGAYATAWAFSLVVFLAASVLVGVLNGIPVLGAVIGAFVFFYAQVVAARLWADGYGDARTEAEETSRPEVGGSTA
ncbi:DUF4013 domain-containing protein [Halobaculum magnesiiphilum]|uniref:DUF4013 domain-containing protein n=1 Tax=Halobaculum magnesiiphilum TaxID=1017351 RepID=A0A8T8WAA0_9EURY|nr:DUF4013 domain-containing protein [Halobaculum magnesiiphilum]QZP36767.1 DUF4013 domain-containing protein [Halobaculum magnesiiphilum]